MFLSLHRKSQISQQSFKNMFSTNFFNKYMKKIFTFSMFCFYCTPARHDDLIKSAVVFYLPTVFIKNSSLVLVSFCMILTFYGC